MDTTAFIATSLDGFIARENGAIDWLPTEDGAQVREDYGYGAFFKTVDALVMGRNTFEVVRTFGAWPYGSKPVIVLTHRELDIPAALRATVESASGSPARLLERLRARGWKHLYVDGGKTVQGFLAEGLIRRLIVTRIPILLGKGIPLFGPVPGDVHLRHVGTRSYPTGLVQSEYQVLAKEPDQGR